MRNQLPAALLAALGLSLTPKLHVGPRHMWARTLLGMRAVQPGDVDRFLGR